MVLKNSAGADPTRTFIMILLLYLLRSPDKLRRLQAAITEEAPDLKPESLIKVSYLEACLKEVTRLETPTPSNLQRICPAEGALIDGIKIPAGTKVRFSSRNMQRDPRHFGSPDQFLPERWLKDPSPVQPHDTRAFFPFMIGPGTCAAKKFALMQMRMVRRFFF